MNRPEFKDPRPAKEISKISALLSRADLKQRWQCGSHSFFQRAETDGLLKAGRYTGRPGYRWEDVWDFEGGQPPEGLEDAYRADLLTPDELEQFCPFRSTTLIRKAATGELPCRHVGRFIRFVPYEVECWLRNWS